MLLDSSQRDWYTTAVLYVPFFTTLCSIGMSVTRQALQPRVLTFIARRPCDGPATGGFEAARDTSPLMPPNPLPVLCLSLPFPFLTLFFAPSLLLPLPLSVLSLTPSSLLLLSTRFFFFLSVRPCSSLTRPDPLPPPSPAGPPPPSPPPGLFSPGFQYCIVFQSSRRTPSYSGVWTLWVGRLLCCGEVESGEPGRAAAAGVVVIHRRPSEGIPVRLIHGCPRRDCHILLCSCAPACLPSAAVLLVVDSPRTHPPGALSIAQLSCHCCQCVLLRGRGRAIGMALSFAPAAAVVSALAIGGSSRHVSGFMLQSHAFKPKLEAGGGGLRPPYSQVPTATRGGTDFRLQPSAESWTLSRHRQQQLLQCRTEHQRHRATRTARSAAATTMSAADQIGPGSVVVFDSDVRGRPPALGLVTESSVGKKKLTYTVQPVEAASGSSTKTTVAARQVRYVVPGGSGYQAADLVAFEDRPEIDEGLIEEAWDMMLEESTVGSDGAAAAAAANDDPRGMAELLFGVGDPSPQQCYHAFRLLEGRDGTLYFKRRRDGTYECRSR